jgi:hypothetical protein
MGGGELRQRLMLAERTRARNDSASCSRMSRSELRSPMVEAADC